MRDLHTRVQRVLEAEPLTRGSDNILYLEVIKDMGYKKTMSLLMMAELVSEGLIPSLDSVGRCRRKVQELHPELMPSDEVAHKRAEREKMFREYARRRA